MNRNPALSALSRPQVLLFNFRPDLRTMRIVRYLTESGVAVRQVPPAAFGETLEHLLALQDYRQYGEAKLPRFREEMLLMSGFDRDRLDAFLRFFRDEQILRVDLKAMLTPTNAGWSAARLHDQLLSERDVMKTRLQGR